MVGKVVDLNSDANKLLANWFSRQLEPQPERAMRPQTWSVPCAELYARYTDWAATTPFRIIGKDDFAKVLYATFPESSIANFGVGAERRFINLRLRVPQ